MFSKRIVKIGITEYAISDNKDSLTLSAFFLREILKKPSAETGVLDETLSGLIEFVVDKSEGAEVTELKHILQAAKMVESKGIRFPVLRNQLVT